RVERSLRRAVPDVDTRRPESQLVQVGLADDAGVGVPGPGHAPRVLLGRGGGVGDRLAAGGRRHSFHVDEVLDRQAGPGPGAVQLGDECAHAYTVTRGVTPLNAQIASPARRRFRAARVVATLAAREGGPP